MTQRVKRHPLIGTTMIVVGTEDINCYSNLYQATLTDYMLLKIGTQVMVLDTQMCGPTRYRRRQMLVASSSGIVGWVPKSKLRSLT
jgi:hypothetical protein